MTERDMGDRFFNPCVHGHDIKPMHGVGTLCVHFSKGTQNRFSRPDVETLTYPARLASPLDGSRRIRELEEQVTAQAGELALIKNSRAWHLVSVMRRARSRLSVPARHTST